MNRHTRPLSLLLALVLGLVAALCLGSPSNATASRLTRGVVKKIATKVVTQKASGLSVAHANTAESAATATTATNATALDGKPASTYTTTAYRFRLPNTPGLSNQEWEFHVAPGDYNVTYSVTVKLSGANTYLTCGVFPDDQDNVGSEARSYGGELNEFSGTSGAATMSLPTGLAILSCTASSVFTIDPDDGSVSSADFTRINSVVDATANPN